MFFILSSRNVQFQLKVLIPVIIKNLGVPYWQKFLRLNKKIDTVKTHTCTIKGVLYCIN